MSDNPRTTDGPVPPPPPPPPPPLPPVVKEATAPLPAPPKAPSVDPEGPEGAFMVELLIYNGAPFKDHWAYWVRSHASPDVGVLLHATGDVRNGFTFEIKRKHDLEATGNLPTDRVPLQWVSARYFDEKMMLGEENKIDHVPVCGFEASASKIKAPGKSLNTVSDRPTASTKMTQRNCQTWIVESADQLFHDCIFSKEAVTYLRAIKQ